ncbi:MAG: chaperone modulator CbpM [Gallionella sp.]|nr:chaperone modulator CbpM [Gallionella sp.]MDD4958714.1 chaperone modulator CbpM [Gallionella sp.]
MNTENNLSQLTICIHEEQTQLTLADLCRACSIHADEIIALVEVGVLEPQGREPEQWVFIGDSLHRARKALRLQRDLGIDFAGAALVLELLDEIASLRTRLRAMGGEL